MKKSYIYRIYAMLFLLLSATACALDGDEECLPCKKVRTVDVQLAGTLPASGLTVPLYVFLRPAGTQEEYVFNRRYEAVADGETLRLPLAEIKDCDYRFLAIAQPGSEPWLTLRTAGGEAFAPGAAWSDLRLTSATGRAELEGYCGFTDKSGAAILSDGMVRLTLTRIAGQLLFDFYRIGGSLAEPVGIVSPGVESVIDRVCAIEIEYANPTTALRFDADDRLVPAAYGTEPLRQVIAPEMADFKVPLPQTDKGLGLYDAALRGSLRIAGATVLPSDEKLRVKAVFTYYDTTPACGNGHAGDHSQTCYPQRQVTLRLPAETSAAGLPVAADCFTVNRAGLRCDRIIDVPANGGIVTDFKWL